MLAKRRKISDMEPMDVQTTVTSKKRKFNPGTTPVPKAIKQYVQRAIRASEELKFFDTPISGTATSASYYGLDLLKVPQGASQNQRIGDEIKVKKIEMHVNFQAGDDWNRMRFLILTNPTTQPDSTTSAISSLRTTAPTENSHVLRDHWFTMAWRPTTGNSAAQSPGDSYLWFSKKVNWNCKFATGGTASPLNRQLYFQLHSDSTIVPNPGVQGYARVYFTDS